MENIEILEKIQKYCVIKNYKKIFNLIMSTSSKLYKENKSKSINFHLKANELITESESEPYMERFKSGIA
jgi:hypothetical protein